MDFAFSEEQEMLRSQARSFVADRFGAERVAQLAETDAGWDEGSWDAMTELGWMGLSIPEEQGGAGFGFLEEAVLFEELGYGLYPGPYFSTVALARRALDGAPEQLKRVASGGARFTLAWIEGGRTKLLPETEMSTQAQQSSEGWTLTGEKHLVPDASAATDVVVVASGPEGPGLWVAHCADAKIEMDPTMDRTRRLGRIIFDGTPAELVAGDSDVRSALARVQMTAYSALALEAVGAGQAAFELAADHVKTREQFGKPIGAYQAVSHQVVDSYIGIELARSLAYWAAWCVADGDERAPAAAAAAKSFAGEAAVAACERAIQVHGGIGFTYEHPLHRYYKRAQWIDSFDGFGSVQRASVAAALLGP